MQHPAVDVERDNLTSDKERLLCQLLSQLRQLTFDNSAPIVALYHSETTGLRTSTVNPPLPAGSEDDARAAAKLVRKTLRELFGVFCFAVVLSTAWLGDVLHEREALLCTALEKYNHWRTEDMIIVWPALAHY